MTTVYEGNMAESEEERTVISLLVDNQDKAGIKTVVHQDGKTVCFQRAAPQDDSNWLEEVAPVLEEEVSEDENGILDIPEQMIEPESTGMVRGISISGLPIDNLGNPDLILPNSCEVEQVAEERAFVQQTNEIPPSIPSPSGRKSLLLPKIEAIRSPTVARTQTKKHTEEVPAPATEMKQKSDFGLRVGIGFLIIATLFLIISISLKKSGNSHESATGGYVRIENEIISQLNDCFSPIQSFPINPIIPEDFIEYVKSDQSEFLRIRDESFVLKKYRKSWICLIVDFGDRHPDLMGLLIFWVFVFIVYVFCVIQKKKARRLLPVVFGILEGSKDRMCFIEDVRSQMEAKGARVGWSWRFIVGLMEQHKDVKTVKMEYSKPFWTLKNA
jgi:hypothetical protein